MDTDKHVERAIAIGEANQRTVELVRNWCANIRIDKQGWGGLIEQMNGLPIGPRSLSCPYAAASGYAGSNLEFLAVDFHDRNCVGCAHRKPVGLPNLSTLIHERDTARAASDAETAHREAAAAAALQERDTARQAIRAALAPAGADVIDQIGELDRGRDSANGDRLVETARLAPDVFTAPVVAYAFDLIEAGETWFDAVGLRMLSALKADPTRLTRCALLCLPRRVGDEVAADVLAENLGLADETLIGPAIPALISMASPRRLLLGDMERQAHAGPLLRTHAAFPKAVEDAIGVLLDGADPYDIGRAARGIAVLADHDPALPGRFARSLIAKYVRDRRLLQASEHFDSDGSGETLTELRQVLGLAFAAAPAATDTLLKAFLAGATDTAEARILTVYSEALHQPLSDGDAEPTEASRLALSRIVWHATATNSYAVLHEIVGFLSGGPWKLKLGAEEVRDLLGAATLLEGKLQSLSVAPVIDDPLGLTAMARVQVHDEIKTVRESLIRWAAAGAGQTLDGTNVYLEVLAGLPAEGDDDLKIDMVRNLNEVMKTTAGLTAVLPQLYTAMVGASVALRACAVYAIGELDHRQQDNLPGLVFEAFMALLLDPYRAVHKHAARALRRTGLPEEYEPRAKAGLVALITVYARGRQDDHFLIECLDCYIDRHAAPGEFNTRRGSWLISVLEKIEPWVVAREITTFGRALREHDRYIPYLIRLLGDARAWDLCDRHLTRALVELPAAAVHRHLEALEALAVAVQAQDRRIDGQFIELFTRAGAWDVAVRLAQSAVEALPDDAWNRPRKLRTDQIRAATAFEAALASGSADQVSQLAGEWRAIGAAIEKDRTENADRRDPIRGLRSQN